MFTDTVFFRLSLRLPHRTDATTIPLPEEGTPWIDQPLVAHELTTLRTCVNRQQPFGTPEWQQQLATTLGLESTLPPEAALQNLSSLSPFLLPA